MNIDITILIAVIGSAVSVAAFFIGRMTAAKTSGQEYGVMLTEIGYIKSGVDDMKKKMEQSDKRYIEMEKRLSKVEEAMKIYWIWKVYMLPCGVRRQNIMLNLGQN